MPVMTAATRYAAAAGRLRDAIAAGTYPVGTRLPSVRALAGQWDLAVNTVIAAYRLLEREGAIAALPRCGFTVLPRPLPAGAPPRPAARIAAPTAIDLAALLRQSVPGRPGTVPLGVAIPSPDWLPLAALRRHLLHVQREHADLCLAYDSAPGREELRRAVARRLLAGGAAVDPEAIVVTNGAQEALNLVLRAICPPGACVAVESPAYPGLIHAIACQGLNAIEIPSSAEGGISLPALRLALDEHPLAAVLCTTTWSNPCGACLDDGARRELVALCTAHGVPLIDDDTYGELGHHTARAPLCLAHDRGGQVVHVGSFSKCMAPGLRLGFAVPGRWREAVVRHKILASIATAVAPQLAVARLLDSGEFDRHRRRTAPLLAAAVQRCASAVRAAFPAGTRVSQPGGGFVLWVEMPAGVDAQRLYLDAERAGIGIAPGPLFSPRGRYRHHCRLTAGRWDEAVARAIATVGRLAGHQLGRRTVLPA